MEKEVEADRETTNSADAFPDIDIEKTERIRQQLEENRPADEAAGADSDRALVIDLDDTEDKYRFHLDLPDGGRGFIAFDKDDDAVYDFLDAVGESPTDPFEALYAEVPLVSLPPNRLYAAVGGSSLGQRLAPTGLTEVDRGALKPSSTVATFTILASAAGAIGIATALAVFFSVGWLGLYITIGVTVPVAFLLLFSVVMKTFEAMLPDITPVATRDS